MLSFCLFQAYVFHVEAHPNVTWYKQCITYNAFPSPAHELGYAMFGMIMMYTFPLVVIFYSYATTFMEIYRRARESSEGMFISQYTDTRLQQFFRLQTFGQQNIHFLACLRLLFRVFMLWWVEIDSFIYEFMKRILFVLCLLDVYKFRKFEPIR